jgi:hypothetical protein
MPSGSANRKSDYSRLKTDRLDAGAACSQVGEIVEEPAGGVVPSLYRSVFRSEAAIGYLLKFSAKDTGAARAVQSSTVDMRPSLV